MKKKKRKIITIDKTLTPESAGERGYIWWCDDLYHLEDDTGEEEPFDDDFNPNDHLRAIIRIGALIGQAANPHFHRDVVGVYWPIDEESDNEKAPPPILLAKQLLHNATLVL